MSFTKQVFVLNGTDVVTTPANDSLTVYVNQVATAAADIAAAGTADLQLVNKLNNTVVFKAADVVKADKRAYTAGTSQVLTAAVTREADGTAYIKLIDVTEGREKFEMATFEAKADTNAAAATALAAAINASKRDAYADVSATATDDDIAITIPKGYIFRAAANDATTVTQTTAAVLPVGVPALVRKEVEEALPYMGITNIAGPNVKRFADEVSSSTTYSKVVIGLEKTVGERDDRHEIVLYYPSNITAYETALNTLFGITL